VRWSALAWRRNVNLSALRTILKTNRHDPFPRGGAFGAGPGLEDSIEYWGGGGAEADKQVETSSTGDFSVPNSSQTNNGLPWAAVSLCSGRRSGLVLLGLEVISGFSISYGLCMSRQLSTALCVHGLAVVLACMVFLSAALFSKLNPRPNCVAAAEACPCLCCFADAAQRALSYTVFSRAGHPFEPFPAADPRRNQGFFLFWQQACGCSRWALMFQSPFYSGTSCPRSSPVCIPKCPGLE